jgi:hypothetical protein
MLRMMATSVVKASDLIRLPNTRMPEHSAIALRNFDHVASERAVVGRNLFSAGLLLLVFSQINRFLSLFS